MPDKESKKGGLLLLCASPRPQGTSMMLLDTLRQTAGGDVVLLREGREEEALDAMAAADCWVISGPCYLCGYPGQLISLLERAARRPGVLHGQAVYGIINGGMPYVHTHASGLRTLRLFCEANGLRALGGFVLGGGAGLNGQPLRKHLFSRRMVPAFDTFARRVAAREASPDQLYERAHARLPVFLSRLMTWMLNRLVDRQIRRHGHDPREPFPLA